jgi:hypothetical protein
MANQEFVEFSPATFWQTTISVSNFHATEKQTKRECVSICTDIHLHLFYDAAGRR